ncbi:MAG TPA: hypothetical protein VFV75_05550 [Candidatus Polarisedimenticolaceae bacterium]|nr:hypothetical protein [Candidatus Polarisedimenticolaceae bacterium]
MLTSRRAAGLLLLFVLSVTPAAATPLAEDPQAFRLQMMDFLQRTEDVLTHAMQSPALGRRVELALNAQMLQLPFPKEMYDALANASTDELQQMREALAAAPGFLSAPEELDAALALLPEAPAESLAYTCGDNYQEWTNSVTRVSTVRGLTIAYDTLSFIYSIFNTITEVVGATTEDTPYVGKVPAIPFIVIRGVLGVVQSAVGFARSDISYQAAQADVCLAGCFTDDQDIHGQPTKFFRYRGCDNRDNNCADGIDDNSEDLFPPELSFDPAVVGHCFKDAAAAQAAAGLAVRASDDCSKPTVSVALGPVSAACRAAVSVTATDHSSNTASLSGAGLVLTVDGQPPQIAAASLNACYGSMEAARSAFTTAHTVTDCTGVRTQVAAVEKECVADLRLTAVDACGNQSTVADTVRVDASAPVVDVKRLIIPTVKGLACFPTQAAAQQAVETATVATDNCTLPEDLVKNTTFSGDACNLEIRQTATDQCGRSSSDAMTVRVDKAPPVVSCAVATSVLYPANNALVDVGFTYQATDNCEPNGPKLDVEVKSDEPTLYAYTLAAGADPAPDAIVQRSASGAITRIQLRAQRSQTSPADGRVYRIRLTATDSCGLSSFADCYVTVPRTNPGPGSAVNSGLEFDATATN